MLVSLKGPETNWAGLGVSGVGMTELGGFRDLKAGTVIEAGDAGSGIRIPLSGP